MTSNNIYSIQNRHSKIYVDGTKINNNPVGKHHFYISYKKWLNILFGYLF